LADTAANRINGLRGEHADQLSKMSLNWARHGYPEDEAVLDALKVMAQHSDAEVRRRTCAVIAQHFPASYSADCGQRP